MESTRKGKTVCILGNDFLKLSIETVDIEQLQELINRTKPVEYSIEYYFQKPLKECSLEEIMKTSHQCQCTTWLDTVDYVDNGSLHA